MDKKKEIGSAFKERLDHLQKLPGDAVWDKIEAQLPPQKKKVRVLPLWLKLGGIAATIAALVFFVSKIDFNNNISAPTDTIEIVETEKEHNDNRPLDTNEANKTEQVTVDKRDTINKNTVHQLKNSIEDNRVVAQDQMNSTDNKENNNNNSLVVKASEENRMIRQDKSSQINNNTMSQSQMKEAIAIEKNISEEKKRENNVSRDIVKIDQNTSILKEDTTGEKKEVVVAKNLSEKIAGSQDNLLLKERDSSLVNTTNTTVVAEISNDSITVKNKIAAASEINSLHDKTVVEDEVVDEKNKNTRWSVAPIVAPVFYNSFNSGSSIDAMVGQKNSSPVSYSYGVQLGYAISEKLTLTSGFNKLDVNYDANNIEASSVNETSFNEPISSIDVEIDEDMVSLDGMENGVTLENVDSFNQNISYFEVPVHLQYQLLDNDFSLSVLAGGSTYILENNRVNFDLTSGTTVTGGANNINAVSYSLNAGIGAGYKINKSLQFTIDPIFKAKLNTYANNSDFQPYIFGVYTGFKFKF